MRGRHVAMLALACSFCACGPRPLPYGWFKDQAVVWEVEDTRSIAEPQERKFYPKSYLGDVLVFDPVMTALRPPERSPALNTNALDEVPDSTWFTNRIGVRDLSPQQAARGPTDAGPPQPPLTIVAAKTGGANPGFIASDARGIRFIVKFDTRENPEQQTASNVIVGRIFWALGYHVPEDFTFHFRREQLSISKKMQARGVGDAALMKILASATRRKDGAYRATASRFLAGIPKGGFPAQGVRRDDPNDTIPHEHRRELRALRVLCAWLGHTDMKEDNTLDMYVTEGERRFLRHYFVDFGEALGGHQSEKEQLQIGWEYAWDWKNQTKALLAAGLWIRPWERQQETPWKSIGYFGAKHFDPETWHPRYDYAPFDYVEPADLYWGAKLVMRFDRSLLEAIVAEGQLTSPAAARYLVDTLLARRHKIGVAYLDRVTPLDDFQFRNGQLCATDLATYYGVAGGGLAKSHDLGAGVRHTVQIGEAGQVCVPLSPGSGYRIIKMHIRRGGAKDTRKLQLHVMLGRKPRVLGIVR